MKSCLKLLFKGEFSHSRKVEKDNYIVVYTGGQVLKYLCYMLGNPFINSRCPPKF